MLIVYCRYRSTVLSFSKDHVKLRYVDYGNEAEVSYADTREIKEDFTLLPSLSISCLLHDVHLEDLNADLAKSWLQDTCCDEAFKIKIVAVHEHIAEVYMYPMDSEESTNDELYAQFGLEIQEELRSQGRE